MPDFRRLVLAAALLLAPSSAWAANLDPYDALLRDPPRFPTAGAEAFHFSSADPLGGNEDFSHFLRLESGGVHVLADQHGAGMVTRIWLTASEATMARARLRIWIDSPAAPTVDLPVNDFFSGDHFPFAHPLVTDRTVSSGGYNCYLPIPFSERVVIDVTGLDAGRFYYNISGLIYEDPWSVQPFAYPVDGGTAERIRGALAALGNSGPPDLLPGDTGSDSPIKRRDPLLISPGETVTVFSATRSGELAFLRFAIPGVPRDELMDLSIQCTWDGAAEPAVDLPVPFFFAAGAIDTRGFLAGRVGDIYYSRFPMLFSSEARIALTNSGATPVRIASAATRFVYLPGIDTAAPKLHAAFHDVAETGSERRFPWLRRAGRGWFAGVVMEMAGEGEFGYLEGDEFITVDGEAAPRVIGTGTEDYFGGGWYFEHGPFSLPFHGCVTKTADARTVCYRFHLLDAVPYRRSIDASLENGTNNTFRGAYRAAVFWYEARGGGALPADAAGSAEADALRPPPGTNLLSNPGAEDFLAGWTAGGVPNNMPTIDPWTHTPDPPNHSGHHRFGISIGYQTVDCHLRQTVRVRPGRPHRAVFHATNQDGTDEYAELLWIDGPWPGDERPLVRTPDGAQKEWTRYESPAFTPASNQVTLVVRFRHPVPSGIASIHLDDLELVEIAE